ncbi:MAG TPA: sulfotransferase [Candidatus Limnocylindria bacterium]|jgi:hypothetical protein
MSLATDDREAASPPAEAIFVVGVHRSGTTLMRSILNSSSLVALTNENHYFGHLLAAEGVHRAIRALGDLHDDAVVERAVAHVYDRVAVRHWFRDPSRAWVWLQRNVPREEFRERLLASDRSERAVFDTLLRLYAERRGKTIIGEKTPAHVRHGDRLLEWYPGGRVIHMLRDPRAIYVSDLRRRRQVPGALPFRVLNHVPGGLAAVLLVQTTVAWIESVVRLRDNRRRHAGRYLVVRFEDLVSNPREEVRRVCRFVGIPFEEQMMDRVVESHGQTLGSSGFDSGAASRWRGQISPLAAGWFRLWLGRRMRALGYAD